MLFNSSKVVLLYLLIVTQITLAQTYTPDICDELFFNNDTIKLCEGDSTEITLQGNYNDTKWSAQNGTYDSIAPNRIRVAPNQTTTYVVRNYKKENNLIQNSDFELGNTNFTTS